MENKKETILVVEDDSSIRETLKDLLLAKGFAVETAINGLKGLEKANTCQPDLILTDVMMPKMNGVDMVKELRQNSKLSVVPIIFLSAKAEIQDIQEGLKSGAEDYIIKPFRFEDVLESISNRLEKVRVLKKENKMLQLNVDELTATNLHLTSATFRERDLRTKLQDTLDELSETKKELEKHHKEIKDSINYSQKIQSAIIPENEELSELFADSLLLFKPRDIVSGDFPWMWKTDKYVYLGAVDCTGHGVPGAMLSIIGNLLLHEAVNLKQFPTPSWILEKLDSSLQSLFTNRKIETHLIGGMDAALIRVDLESNEVLYSGAPRPLHLITKDGGVKVYKGERRSIGGHSVRRKLNFTDVTIKVDKGDSIFMYSDGYVDQLSETDRKIGRKNLEPILVEYCNRDFKELSVKLEEYLHEWKGSVKQIDDILVIGVKF